MLGGFLAHVGVGDMCVAFALRHIEELWRVSQRQDGVVCRDAADRKRLDQRRRSVDRWIAAASAPARQDPWPDPATVAGTGYNNTEANGV